MLQVPSLEIHVGSAYVAYHAVFPSNVHHLKGKNDQLTLWKTKMATKIPFRAPHVQEFETIC